MSGFSGYDYHFHHAGTEWALRWISCGKSTCKGCPHGPYFYQVTQKYGKGALKYYGKELNGIGNATDFAITLWKTRCHKTPSNWLYAKGLISKSRLETGHDRGNGEGPEDAERNGNSYDNGNTGHYVSRFGDRFTNHFEPVNGTIYTIKIKGIPAYEWIQKTRVYSEEGCKSGCEICRYGRGFITFDESAIEPYRDTGYPPPAHLEKVGSHIVCRGCLLDARRTVLQLMQVIPGFSPMRHKQIKSMTEELKLWKKVVKLVYPKV